MASTTILDLPAELLHDIFGYIGWKEALESRLICKKIRAVVERDYFWKVRLEDAIQLPYSLSSLPRFKDVPTMRVFLAVTRARAYTWGESTFGKLGHSYPVTNSSSRSHKGVGIPLEIRTLRDVFIVDIKAGGWSTHFLTFDGEVYSYGLMSGHMRGDRADRASDAIKMKIDTPVARISAGRNHLIALTTKGEIYSYEEFHKPPKKIHFTDHHIEKSDPYSSSTETGKVRKIVGGWDCSGALVYGRGLIIWKFDKYVGDAIMERWGEGLGPDDRLVQENLVTAPIPEPQEYQKNIDLEREKEIIDFILIERFIVFVTAGGRVYCLEQMGGVPILPPVFLPHFSVDEPTDEEIADREGYRNKKADRISGFFRKFAVYNRNGLVHVGDIDLLGKAVEQERRQASSRSNVIKEEVEPLAIPSLKKFGTIAQIVFGDYHSHAVTQDGRLLSWGVESQNCGCLGIGNFAEAERRGVQWHWENGTLDEAAEVFFHDPPYPKSCYPTRGPDGRPEWATVAKQEDSEEGEEEEVLLDKREFCVLGVSAAGWHSAALVLPVSHDFLGGRTKHLERYKAYIEPIQARAVEKAFGKSPPSPTRERVNSIEGDINRHSTGENQAPPSPESSHRNLEVDINTLAPPFVGHGGVEGISTTARGMRRAFFGRARGGRGLSASGVRIAGQDEEMRQRNQELPRVANARESEDGRPLGDR